MKNMLLQLKLKGLLPEIAGGLYLFLVAFAMVASYANLTALSIADASTPEDKGLAVALAADKRDTGWSDWSADAEMILRNRHGESSSRQMLLRSLEQEKDGDKRIIIFNYPRDVKGTAFLVYTRRVGNDDQWLYLPALKRVKRISANNQSGPFVGSEFAYEDLSSQEVEKYTYKYLREERVDGHDSYVIERYPVDSKSGYTRQVTWIDKSEFRTIKTDYYDRKGELLKTFTAHDFQLYPSGYWRADKFVMNNHQTGKSTELVWDNYVFGQGFSDRNFDQNSLKNAR